MLLISCVKTLEIYWRKNVSDKETIKKLLGLLADYKKTLIIIIISLVFSAVLNLWIPLLSKDIMDQGFIAGNNTRLIELVLISTVFYIANSIIEIYKECKRADIAAKLEYSLSERAVTHLLKMKMKYFNTTNYAEIMNMISVDIGNILSVADDSMFFVITQIFNITGGIIGLFIIDYRLTLIVLVFIPVKYLIMKFFARKRKVIMNEFIEANKEYAKWFGDTIDGILEIKLFGVLNNKMKEFKEKQRNPIDKKKKLVILSEVNNTTDTVILQLLVMIIYIIGANMVFDLQLSIGSIFAFITYSTYVTGPISAILNVGYLLSGIVPSTKRFYEFMELEEEDKEENNKEKKKEEISFGDLEIKNVSFSYDGKKNILEGITLRFPKGSKTAIIGENGSGKSTIIRILSGLYDVNQGEVLIKGVNIKNLSLSKYREMFSIVSQQIYLFDDTIKNNVSLYKEASEQKIMQALNDSGLEEFMNKVSLDYRVGQNGAMLSGGQKQKIALARAFIQDRPILIFDEATSNSDSSSEYEVNQLLRTKMENKTIIIITHRTEILQDMDYIIYLKDAKATQINSCKGEKEIIK